LWQYLRKEPAYLVKAYAVLVNIINFIENSLRLALTAVTLFFLTTYAQLVATTRGSKFSKSRLRPTLKALKLNLKNS
jgi:hypothetical protein